MKYANPIGAGIENVVMRVIQQSTAFEEVERVLSEHLYLKYGCHIYENSGRYEVHQKTSQGKMIDVHHCASYAACVQWVFENITPLKPHDDSEREVIAE